MARKSPWAVVLFASLALVLGACSSSATNSGGSTAGSSADSPIKIGLINENAGSVGAYPEAAVAAQAAVDYINNRLNGVGGRRLKLYVCDVDGTVGTSQQCAEQMVSDGVAFVMGGLDPNQDVWYSILGPAGIPVIGGIPETQHDYTATDAYNFQGGTATIFPALSEYVHVFDPQVKSVGIILNDTPGATGSLPLIEKPLKSWGVKYTAVTVPTTQTDWTAPFIQVSKGNKVVIALLSGPNCVSLASASASQGNPSKIVLVGPCDSSTVYQATGKEMNGWIVTGSGPNPLGTSVQAKLYQQIMHKYAGAKANLSGFAPATFMNVMTAYLSVLKPLAGKTIDKASLIRQVTDSAGGNVFLGGKYKCPGVPFRAVCSYEVNYFTIENDNLVNGTSMVDTAPALQAAIKS